MIFQTSLKKEGLNFLPKGEGSWPETDAGVDAMPQKAYFSKNISYLNVG